MGIKNIVEKVLGRYPNRLNDFEGRCANCHKSLKLIVTRITIHSIKLNVIPCPQHPNESYILWPANREDIGIKKDT